MKQNSNKSMIADKSIAIYIPIKSFLEALEKYVANNLSFEFADFSQSKIKSIASYLLNSQGFISWYKEYLSFESYHLFEFIGLCDNLGDHLSNCSVYNDLVNEDNEKLSKFESSPTQKDIKAAKDLLESNGYSVKLHRIP